MRKLIIHIIFISIVVTLITIDIRGNTLQAFFSYSTFNTPQKGPYVELYLSVIGKSANYKLNENKKYQSSIQIIVVYKQETSVRFFDKYNLLSPEIDDTSKIDFNFLDQHRALLSNGEYILELTIKDNNDTANTYFLTHPIKINFPPNIISISDIELLESYSKSQTVSKITKSGYDVIPLVNNFYPTQFKSIKFYAELYNVSSVMNGQDFLISYYLETYHTNNIIPAFQIFSKQKANDVNVVLAEIPIENLPSGNYNLVLEARNKNNEVLASKKYFLQRSNKNVDMTDSGITTDIIQQSFVMGYKKEQLKEYILSMQPILSQQEFNYSNNVISSDDEDLMRQYFYNYWARINAVNPEQAWIKYSTEVDKVNSDYGTKIKKGYNTDRGRVYLKNGAPNTVSESKNEPSAYPYEVWHYYKLGDETNKKFVFYSPYLATNEYMLLHSDARGEVYNEQWKLIIHKRTIQNTDFDRTKENKYFGGRVSDVFDE